MEELIKLQSEVKQYCVYAHYYEDQLFYIGSGVVYKNSGGELRGRPYGLNFTDRSPEWWEFCKGENDKVTVEILFVTNDKKKSFDKEEEITKACMDQGFSLVNKNIGTHPGKEQKRKLSEANKRVILSEEARKKIGEVNKSKKNSGVKQYCVYAHYYEDQLFYIGSGRIYTTKSGLLSGRPFRFKGRSLEWFEFCNWETDKVIVEILFVTDDEKLSYDKEEEITRYYMELEMPLVNKYIGNKMSEEWVKEHLSGENNPFHGMTHTKEIRELISKANKGKVISEEQRRKISEAQKGKILSAETRNKISLAQKGEKGNMYGKKHSAETIKKMSEAHKGEKHHMYSKNHSVESRKKISEVLKGKMSSENNPMYGKKHTKEAIKQMSEVKKGKNNPMYGKRGKDAPMYGRKHSEESRKQMSEARKGRIISEEQKRNMSLAQKGRIFNEEHKRKLSEAHKGKILSEEHRRNIGEAKKGENNPSAKKVLITNNETGEQINFSCIKDAHKFIVEKGYPNKYSALKNRFRKGPFQFNNYTLEKIA